MERQVINLLPFQDIINKFSVKFQLSSWWSDGSISKFLIDNFGSCCFDWNSLLVQVKFDLIMYIKGLILFVGNCFLNLHAIQVVKHQLKQEV